MKLPRDVSGAQLVKALQKFGYKVTRQSGSHIRLTLDVPPQHHVTIPNHDSLKIGTMSAILSDIATHLKISRDELIKRIFN